MKESFDLGALEAIIQERAKASPDVSWTAKLMASGKARIAKKFGEEAIEAIIAAVGSDRHEFVKETADVIFHLLVLMKACDVPLSEVLIELQLRTEQSGVAEKASR